MKVVRPQQRGGTEWRRRIHSRQVPARCPIAISRIDEAALQGVASRIGVSYVHSPDKSAIDSYARSILTTCQSCPKSETKRDTYRYIIWPFALILGGLLAWEGATLALRAQHVEEFPCDLNTQQATKTSCRSVPLRALR